MSGPYDDIIDLPHHTSRKHPRMSLANRAAQFSPFAALTGYDAAVKETARLTDEQVALDENTVSALDMKLRLLSEKLARHPEIAVTYFEQDVKKSGGAYVTASGTLVKIDDYSQTLVLQDGRSIAITDIIEIDCELFSSLLF